jgi:hypothetical protein
MSDRQLITLNIATLTVAIFSTSLAIFVVLTAPY